MSGVLLATVMHCEAFSLVLDAGNRSQIAQSLRELEQKQMQQQHDDESTAASASGVGEGDVNASNKSATTMPAKEYALSSLLLQLMLSLPYTPHRRGRWIDRLCLNLEKHQGEPVAAMRWLCYGLSDDRIVVCIGNAFCGLFTIS